MLISMGKTITTILVARRTDQSITLFKLTSHSQYISAKISEILYYPNQNRNISESSSHTTPLLNIIAVKSQKQWSVISTDNKHSHTTWMELFCNITWYELFTHLSHEMFTVTASYDICIKPFTKALRDCLTHLLYAWNCILQAHPSQARTWRCPFWYLIFSIFLTWTFHPLCYGKSHRAEHRILLRKVYDFDSYLHYKAYDTPLVY